MKIFIMATILFSIGSVVLYITLQDPQTRTIESEEQHNQNATITVEYIDIQK